MLLPSSEHAFYAPERSIFDRILSFFEKEAAAAAPSNLVSLVLNVSGDGMESMNLSYSAPFPSSVTLEVPAGSDRLFELLASTPSVTFRGTATKDLASGATEDIPIVMALYETKIIIPDSENSRIVQIDNISGTNWTEVSITASPYDIDFDSKGRIYITHSVQVLRMNDITDSPQALFDYDYNYIAIAIDKKRNILYYTDSSYLWKNNLDGTDEFQLNVTAHPDNSYQVMFINGLDIDENGILYISGAAQSEDNTIFKYNPNTETVESIYNNTAILNNPQDVIAKPPYLYVANLTSSGTDNQILQFNLNTLDFIKGYGSYNINSTAPGYFYGASHFVAILNKKMYIIDEGPFGTNRAKLISMDDIIGTNWDTFGTHGTGINMFDFYHAC